LVLPLIIVTLSAFWIASGAIALFHVPQAAAILDSFSDDVARAFVIGGACLDIALGAAILIRRFARPAALGMLATTLAYIGASLLWTPELWSDPLGAMLKAIPVAMLSLAAAALLEER
jgi:uncharacterized membrane protein YphA (DoxX/SURF4 family)